MSASFYDLMKYAKTGIASPDMTDFDKRRAMAAFGGYPVNTITGVPPISFKADGNPLTDYSITGNMVQSSTPSPQNPVYPSETGDLVASGEHAGEYAIPITCGGTTSTIYLQEPIRKIGDYADVAGLSIGGATRRLKKIVLTGDEDFSTEYINNVHRLSFDITAGALGNLVPCICSHYAYNYGFVNNTCYVGTTRTKFYIIDNLHATSQSEFSQFAADQYANGTPITIWYVLQTPTSEPATIPQITTEKGSNTFSIGTTLQPTSVSVTGHIK